MKMLSKILSLILSDNIAILQKKKILQRSIQQKRFSTITFYTYLIQHMHILQMTYSTDKHSIHYKFKRIIIFYRYFQARSLYVCYTQMKSCLISLSGQKTEKSLNCPIRGEIWSPGHSDASTCLFCLDVCIMYVRKSVSSRSQNLLDESKIPWSKFF